MSKHVVVNFHSDYRLGEQLANRLNWPLLSMVIRKFPDDESYVRLLDDCENKHVWIVATLDHPDDKIFPLITAAKLLKDHRAESVNLVSPYLAYMRQDKAFNPGEAVSGVYFGELMSTFFDSIITIDPHLHRFSALADVYSIPGKVIYAAPVVSQWIACQIENPVIIGPDMESEQWVSKVAEKVGCDYLILEKIRQGDFDVSVSDISNNYTSHTPVLVDDIISSGHTMLEVIRQLNEKGFNPAIVVATHGIFAAGAFEKLVKAGVGQIVTANSIQHMSNAIELDELLSVELKGFSDQLYKD